MDQIEQSLTEIADKLLAAWKGNRCLVCPLAELSALAAATLEFYRANRSSKPAASRPAPTALGDEWG